MRNCSNTAPFAIYSQPYTTSVASEEANTVQRIGTVRHIARGTHHTLHAQRRCLSCFLSRQCCNLRSIWHCVEVFNTLEIYRYFVAGPEDMLSGMLTRLLC